MELDLERQEVRLEQPGPPRAPGRDDPRVHRLPRRGDEGGRPLIPLHLFRSRTFSVSVSIALLLGMTMFAALSFLPTFLQMAHGYGATESGLLMLPMTVGLMITAIGSGLLIARTGRYKIFPILGMGIATIGLALLTQLTSDISMVTFGAMIFVLGFGLGLVLQTIVIAVQNSVSPEMVGVATSTNNFLREIGAAVGTSVFSTVFTTKLASNLTDATKGCPRARCPRTSARTPSRRRSSRSCPQRCTTSSSTPTPTRWRPPSGTWCRSACWASSSPSS
ncbi:MFS transporter [Oerskovia sp. M15]